MGGGNADEIAVVASNFSHFPATFSVDNSPLAEAFGANDDPAQPANRCTRVCACSARGVRRRCLCSCARPSPPTRCFHSARAAPAAPPPAPLLFPGHPLTPPPCPSPFTFADSDTNRLRPVPNFGSIWEARDIFLSEFKHDGDDGPLIGFFTSDEAAFAPLPFTLQPHRSSCWLFKVRVGARGGRLRAQAVMGARPRPHSHRGAYGPVADQAVTPPLGGP